MHIAPVSGFFNNYIGEKHIHGQIFLKECKTAGIFEKEKHFPTDVQSEQKLGHTADFDLKAVETVKIVRAQSP